jgi:two-component system, chemotaxis family, chemotaxis protein CheY
MKKILIVDDSKFMRSILKDFLTSQMAAHAFLVGSEIYEANGKHEALIQLNRFMPDVILLDIVMNNSELEGIELLNAIQHRYDINKVIILTSVGQSHLIDQCKKLGVHHYLQKPFEPNLIIDSLRSALS